MNLFFTLYKNNIEIYIFLAICIYAIILWIAIVFWVARDSFKRSTKIWFRLLSILLVANFYFFGLIIYCIIRPTKTLQERKIEDMELDLFNKYKSSKTKAKNQIKKNKRPLFDF